LNIPIGTKRNKRIKPLPYWNEDCKTHYEIETKLEMQCIKIKHWITASIIGVQKGKLSMSSSLQQEITGKTTAPLSTTQQKHLQSDKWQRE